MHWKKSDISVDHHQAWRRTEHLFVAVVEDSEVNLLVKFVTSYSSPLIPSWIQTLWTRRRPSQGLWWVAGGGRACSHQAGCWGEQAGRWEQEEKHIFLRIYLKVQTFGLQTLQITQSDCVSLGAIYRVGRHHTHHTQSIQLSYETGLHSKIIWDGNLRHCSTMYIIHKNKELSRAQPSSIPQSSTSTVTSTEFHIHQLSQKAPHQLHHLHLTVLPPPSDFLMDAIHNGRILKSRNVPEATGCRHVLQ